MVIHMVINIINCIPRRKSGVLWFAGSRSASDIIRPQASFVSHLALRGFHIYRAYV